ncbi:MAG: mannose-1-phosphate guanylyltransferase [Cognaticolwellia sp.]|jgi:mannose-1-phosphate guanylyltransferase
MSDLYALIIAGGVGARFWPRSRQDRPKQCLEIGAGRSLIRRTVDRLAPLISPERIFVVTAASMAPALAELLPEIPSERILVEPAGRNTAAAVGWGSASIAAQVGGNPSIAVLPADHVIVNDQELRSLLADAVLAAQSGALLTLGVDPSRPETGFGYLELGPETGRHGGHVFRRVARFVEKPDAATAKAYLQGGKHLWNAGMFVFQASSLAGAFLAHLPQMWETIQVLVTHPERLDELYPTLQKLSFDVGIMEKAERVLTTRASMGWSDLGSWEAVAEHLPVLPGGRGLGRVLAIDSQNNIVHATGKVVALLGVHDLVVVDTGDALLICPRDQSQRVREVHQLLKDAGLEHLL